MNIVAIVLQVLLGLVFMGAGASKLAGARMQVENFDSLHLPQWFRPVVGIVEIIGVVGILAGVAVPWVAALAALWLVAVMLGALMTHIRVRDVAQNFVHQQWSCALPRSWSLFGGPRWLPTYCRKREADSHLHMSHGALCWDSPVGDERRESGPGRIGCIDIRARWA